MSNTLKCEYCHKEFKAKPYGPRNPRFCSPNCQHKNWADQNRERIRQLWRNAYYRDRETKITRVTQYRRNNPEVNTRSVKRYSQTENGKINNRVRVKRYRARKLGAEGSHTREQFLDLIRLFNLVCPKCGCQFSVEDFTEDHVIPLSKGGNNWINNIQPLCHPCNSGKKDKTIDYRATINY